MERGRGQRRNVLSGRRCTGWWSPDILGRFLFFLSFRQKKGKKTTRSGLNVLLTRYFPTFETENGKLKHIFTPEGKAVPMKKGFEYQYFLKNHLGNTRVVLSQTGKTLQQNSYYLFGMLMAGLPQPEEYHDNKYLYNLPGRQAGGKKLQDDFELGWYDYGKRFYDAGLGRWFVVDAATEKAYGWTPYRYAFDNPINITDPDGMFEGWYENEGKEIVYDEKINSQKDLDEAGIKGEYKGDVGIGVEGEGENQKLVMYGADGQKHDASIGLDEVEINGGEMSEHAKLMNNPIVKSIHKGQQEFLETSVSVVGDALGKVGSGATVIGYGSIMFPGGQIIGAGLIGIGESMMSISGAIDLGTNLKKGNYGKVAFGVATMGTTFGIGKKIDLLQESGKFGEQGAKILKTGSNLKLQLFNTAVNEAITKRKQK